MPAIALHVRQMVFSCLSGMFLALISIIGDWEKFLKVFCVFQTHLIIILFYSHKHSYFRITHLYWFCTKNCISADPEIVRFSYSNLFLESEVFSVFVCVCQTPNRAEAVQIWRREISFQLKNLLQAFNLKSIIFRPFNQIKGIFNLN